MGYPMTFRRLINRNRLAEGGYDAEPHEIKHVMATHVVEAMSVEKQLEIWKGVVKSAYQRLDSERQQRNMLLGDLRRLEADTVDERATATYIAQRTNIDPEVVAAVLKEFISW